MVLTRPSRLLARHPPLHRGQSLHPAPTSHRAGLSLHEASPRVQQFHPSGLPLARGRPDGTGRPWAFPRASHPADQEPTTHVGVATGHQARTWNYALNITSVDPPIGSSLTTCDLASHDEARASLASPARYRFRLGGRRPCQTRPDTWVGREASAHTGAGFAPRFPARSGRACPGHAGRGARSDSAGPGRTDGCRKAPAVVAGLSGDKHLALA
jgi:hypothetical protein